MKIEELDMRRMMEDPSHSEPEKCCGGCCWFHSEDTDGWGFCIKQKGMDTDLMNCSDLCTTDAYVSREKMRHYRALLIQFNRYWCDDNAPIIHECPDGKELAKAVDFANEYMKIFSEL